MSALEEIISWANEKLPVWQQDALRRLLTQDQFTDEDRKEIYYLLKKENGLLDEDDELDLSANPVAKGEVSGAPEEKKQIILKKIDHLKNINAIPDGTSLPFGHTGITVIYGENGTGKSGYARVLKRACKARDKKEPIHPNIFEDKPVGPAEANICIAINGTDQTIPWKDQESADRILSNICVFDSKSARLILTERNEIEFAPYGTDALSVLAEVVKELNQNLREEAGSPVKPFYLDVPADTCCGKYLDRIDENTTEQSLETLCIWNDKLEKALGNAEKENTELKNPAEEAVKKRQLADRYKKLSEALQAAEILADKAAVDKAINLLDEYDAAKKAYEIASESSLSNEPLPAGGNEWAKLFSYAKEYSAAVAYPDKPFPYVADEALCVLCMQELGDDAKERFKRFSNFIEDKASQAFETAKQNLSQLLQLLKPHQKKETVTEAFGDVLGQIKEQNPEIAKKLSDGIDTIYTRLNKLHEAIDKKQASTELAEINCDPAKVQGPERNSLGVSGWISTCAEKLNGEADSLVSNMDNKQVQETSNKITELKARKSFSTKKEEVRKYIQAVKKHHKFTTAAASFDPGPITKYAKAVVKKYSTPELQSTLDAELSNLKAGHLSIQMKSEGDIGKIAHKLDIADAVRRGRFLLTDIFSEGEQRVIAMAGFLAETGISGNAVPLVFDDPVSSLDHIYRSAIAKRLVEISADRQVIVFTHDLPFLVEIKNCCDASNKCLEVTLSRGNSGAGINKQGIPWHCMNTNQRIEYLREEIKKFENLYSTDQPEYDKNAADWYCLLRETWEHLVEEFLFNKTIERFSKEVKTQSLAGAYVDDSDYEEIYKAMSKSSEWMRGHDKSKALDVHRPPPQELKDDVKALEDYRTTIKKRKTDTEKKRKSLFTAVLPEWG